MMFEYTTALNATNFQLDSAFERESVARKESEKVSERLVQLEKDRNSLELELRSMTSRYEQEARALREANSAAATHNHQSTAQALAGWPSFIFFLTDFHHFSRT